MRRQSVTRDKARTESHALTKHADTAQRLQVLEAERAVQPRPGLQAMQGAPLDPTVRADMEARFGVDLHTVRVHDDADAHALADDFDAEAVTTGEHIVYAVDRYAPQSLEGRRLLAHELAHVVQQRRGGAAPEIDPQAAHECAADRAANEVVAGSAPVTVQGATGVGPARAPRRKKKTKATKSGKGGRGANKGAEPHTVDSFTPDGLLQDKAVKRRKHVLEIFDKAAHDPDQDVDLGGEAGTRRSRGSETARHTDPSSRVDEHHGYPKFLGGRRLQRLIPLSKDLHYLYHEELYYKLEEEFKRRGALAGSATKNARSAYGRIYRTLAPADQKAVLASVMAHARDFDARYASTEYPDKRQRVATALQRGISEARTAAKLSAAVKAPRTRVAPSPTPAAPVPVTPAAKPAAPSAPAPAAHAPAAAPAAPAKAPAARAPATATPAARTPAASAPAAAKTPPTAAHTATPKAAARAPSARAPVEETSSAPAAAKAPTAAKTSPVRTPTAATAPAAARPAAPSAARSATSAPRVPAAVKAPLSVSPTVPMRAPRLRGVARGVGGGVAGALLTLATAYLGNKMTESLYQNDLERIQPQIEAQMQQQTDIAYQTALANPGTTVYANVTLETTFTTEKLAGEMPHTMYAGTRLKTVGFSAQDQNDTVQTNERGFGWEEDVQTSVYSMAIEMPFEDLVAYAREHNLSLDTLRAYAEAQLRDAGGAGDGGLGAHRHALWSARLRELE